METTIPSAESVRSMLDGLTLKQLEGVAARSGVPFSTIYKIKRGETKNPGIETLRQFMPFIELIGADGAPAVPVAAEVGDAN
jgi:predicted transcriptional regulator